MAASVAEPPVVPVQQQPVSSARQQSLVVLLFFLSGIPALIYQIVWQRALFNIYGVNVESITVVVSAFMLGLGLGSLAGGYVSKLRVPLLAAFGAVEICTGIYGLASLPLFHKVATFTAGASTFQTGCLAFLLVVLPTVFMGSTLPLLVAYVVQQMPNMGRCTGLLYFSNTLGSGVACFLAGMFLMRLQGQSGSVSLAALLNLLVGTTAILKYAESRKSTVAPVVPSETAGEAGENASGRLPFTFAMVIAGLSGFIALAYEILWYRVFSFATATNPKTFAYLLGAYLIGIAIGSVCGERLCATPRQETNFLSAVGLAIVAGNLFALLVAPLLAQLLRRFSVPYALPAAFVVVALAAAQLGATFPVICHLNVKADRNAGRGLSYLYVSNIVGSTLGSFAVGFVLLDFMSLKQVVLVLAALGVALGLGVLLRANAGWPKLAVIAALSGIVVMAAVPSFDLLYEHLLWKATEVKAPFSELVENRHGVIAVQDDDVVFGGGAYDGRFNVDPVNDTNGIIRVYAAMALHPAPRDVLVIGVGSGSWAQVVVNHPAVEHVTVVEINPGYVPLIAGHSVVASLLRSPKVAMVIDDGHRWLLRNPGVKFDMVVMNTMIHWRAHATNLLSAEFLALIRQHLAPGGIHFYNTTDSSEALVTACRVFPSCLRVGNFVAVSDAPLNPDPQRLANLLLQFHIDARPMVPDPTTLEAQRLFSYLAYSAAALSTGNQGGFYESGDSIRQRLRTVRTVTDDNMATEWGGGGTTVASSSTRLAASGVPTGARGRSLTNY